VLAATFFDPFFQPLVHGLGAALTALHGVIPNYGWTLIVLALVVRLALWPLTNIQFKSMAEMQKVQPLVKALQAKHKGEPQVLNAKMMELYKEHKVNPLAGCVPMLVQFPILIGLFWAIQGQIDQFKNEHFLWIGSAVSQHFPQVLATSLAVPDIILLALYVVSMYFTVRYGSPPSTDPQQAQTQKIMAFVSPAMIAFFGFKYRWASALYIYWLATNVFTVAQQYLMFRRYGLIGAGAGGGGGAAALIDAGPPKGGRGADGKRKGLPAAANDGMPAGNGKAKPTPAANGKQQYARRSKRRAGR
jgi:YidC/Oxa1 family membrane protein insertase